MVPSMILGHGSPGCEKVFHSAMIARSAPAMGVHKPTNRSSPAPTARTCNMGWCDREPTSQCHNPMNNYCNTGNQPHRQKADARRTVGER